MREDNDMQIILATANKDKIKEIREIIPEENIVFKTLADIGFTDDIEENGDTFAANALIKARTVHRAAGGYVLADDSGLSIDVLGGAPGIYSARFAGENADYTRKIAKLQEMLAEYPDNKRQASFICVMALVRPDGTELTIRGECRGEIAKSCRGENGFGYDPVFYVPELGRTMAELDPEHKHRISHRGIALKKMASVLRQEMKTS